MSINHLNLNASTFKTTDGQPKLFSMSKSRGLLENKRINNHPEQPSNKTSHEMHKTPRISLTSLLANSHRTSTPLNPRMTGSSPKHEDARANGGSSPYYRSSASPERAYIPNQPRRFIETSQMTAYQGLVSVRAARNEPSPQAESHSEEYVPEMHRFPPKSRIEQLRNEAERMQVMYNQASRELDDCRSRLEDASRQSQADTSELRTLRPSLASARERLAIKETELASMTGCLSETKSTLADFLEKHALLTEAFNQEKAERQRLATGTGTLKSGIVKLSASYADLAESFKELKTAYDTSQKHLTDLVSDAAETKKLATTSLAALAPMLDDETTLARATETKDILRELAKDLSSSNQVNDMLRDKLHHMGSQLCDAQERIKELDEEKRGALKELLAARQEERRHFEMLLAVEERMDLFSQKLSIRERDSIDALASAASFETQLESALSQLECAQNAREEQILELQAARAEKDAIASNLLALQSMLNTRDKDLATTKIEVKALTESKAELRALLAESKKDLSEKIVELQARDPNIDLQTQTRGLEVEVGMLHANLSEIQDKHVSLQKSSQGIETELRNKVHESEKANAELVLRNENLQESLNKLRDELENDAKELRAQIQESERANSRLESLHARLQESLDKAQHELKSSVPVQMMDKKCSLLDDELTRLKNHAKGLLDEINKTKTDSKDLRDRLVGESSELKERLHVQSIELFRYKEECAVLKERLALLSEQLSLTQSSLKNLEEGGQSLAKSQENRVIAAEKMASFAQAQLDSANEELKQTKAKLNKMATEVVAAKEVRDRLENSSIPESGERSRADRALIEDLERKNAQLIKAADDILTRYEKGHLKDTEKELVGRLMDEAERIHAEGVVKKDNELRRRQRMVDEMKVKIAELQGTIARLLKEKEKGLQPEAGNKSIIGFKPWVSSSPIDVNDANKENAVGPRNGKKSLPTSSVERSLAPTSISAPFTKRLGPGYHKVPNTNMLHDNAESEDDIPLSELSRLSEDSEQGNASGQKRTRSPSPAVEDPNRSKRRTKFTIGPPKPAPVQPTGASPVTRKKGSALEGGTKSKQKKRK